MIGTGKNPVEFTCRGCGRKRKQRRSFYESQVGTPREGRCLDCIGKLERDVTEVHVSLSGRITGVTRGGEAV